MVILKVYIPQSEKRGPFIYLPSWRAIWHAHPYYIIYRRLPSPPPTPPRPPSSFKTMLKLKEAFYSNRTSLNPSYNIVLECDLLMYMNTCTCSFDSYNHWWHGIPRQRALNRTPRQPASNHSLTHSCSLTHSLQSPPVSFPTSLAV